MIRFLKTLFAPAARGERRHQASLRHPEPPDELRAPGVDPFAFRASLQYVDDLPVPDWDAVRRWVGALPDPAERARAWADCEIGWLRHLRVALGPTYHLSAAGDSILLSSLDAGTSKATLSFMNKTQERICRVLDGIAVVPEWGKNLLIVLDDGDTYYRYVARYYEDDGEFAGSGGMHIDAGCSHFVTMKADLRAIEPVIAHEVTHGCLAHLPVPAWLNEGIAVNTEQRLCPPPPPLFTPRELHEKHRRFWGAAEIQEFWSGKSFLRADDGNMLSYDLARILVSQFSGQWESFRDFVLAADLRDAGVAAAHDHLQVDLGAAVRAILERDEAAGWAPDPRAWTAAPEKGAFREPAG